jgi:K+-transporting ATPase KdpF subunit
MNWLYVLGGAIAALLLLYLTLALLKPEKFS